MERGLRARRRGCALRDLHMRILYLIYCVDHPPLYLFACGSYTEAQHTQVTEKRETKGEKKEFPRLLAGDW